MKSIRSAKKESSMLISCIYGLILALIVAMALSLIAALFITNEYLDITTSQFLTTITHLIAVFSGSLLTGEIMSDKKIPSVGVVCAGYIFTMVCLAILVFDGVSGNVFAGIAASIGGSVSAILLCTRRKMRFRGRGYKRVHR